MLDEKLAQANQARRQRYLILTALCGLLLMVGVLGIWNLNLLSRDTGPEDTGTHLLPDFPDAAADKTTTEQPSDPGINTNHDNDTAARDAFIRALGDYDAAVKPRLETPGFAAWNAQEQERLREIRDQVVADFAAGDMASATGLLDQLNQAATAALQSWDGAFDDAVMGVDSALETGDFSQARIAAQQAQKLKPDHDGVRAAMVRIDQAVLVADALENIRITRIEGDAEGEIAAINAALALDPSLTALATRRKTLQKEIKEKQFAAAIQGGFDALSREETATAKQALKQAKKLDSRRDETRILATKLAALEKRLNVEKILNQAAHHTQSDDWDQAHRLYGRVLTLAPENQAAIQGHQQAEKIVSIQNKIDQFIATPHRLSAPNVEKLAMAAMDQSRSLQALSPQLSQSSRHLAELVKDYNRAVAIKLVSDGKTRIAIRGVGRVGLTTDKIINLKPGSYKIEGHREGYVSKLVELDIPVDATMLEVTVICDEPI